MLDELTRKRTGQAVDHGWHSWTVCVSLQARLRDFRWVASRDSGVRGLFCRTSAQAWSTMPLQQCFVPRLTLHVGKIFSSSNKRMSKSCNRALAGKVVYALHKKHIEDPTHESDSDEQSTVGIYSTVKAARAALRSTMAKEVFDTEDIPNPTWADFYVGEGKGRKVAIKRLQNGEPDAEDEFEFPWEEPWRSDGTVAFHVCNLVRNYDDDETDSGSSGDDKDDDDDDDSSDDDESSTDKDAWICEDEETINISYYYEIEAILIR